MAVTCIHANTPFNVPEVCCGVYAWTGRDKRFQNSHGWLCVRHYRDQQASRPHNKRFPVARFVGDTLKHLSDDAYVAEIARSEAAFIAEAREQQRVQTISYGRHDPAVIQFLQ